MAKVKAAKPEGEEGTTEQAAPAAKETKEAKAERNSNVSYKFEKDIGEGQKFAPQAVLIVAAIKAAGTVTRKDLCKTLSENPDFKTRQPIERIVSYYQKDLVNAGILSMPKAATAA